MVVGGSLPVKDGSIFPMSLGYDYFNIPTRTKLLKVVRERLSVEPSVILKVVDLQYNTEVILVTIESTPTDKDANPSVFKVSLTADQ